MNTRSFSLSVGRPQRRPILPFLLLCGVALSLLTLFWLTTKLYADENQPDGLGSLAGQVRDENGQTLAGIQVTLWGQYPFAPPNVWWPIRVLSTEVNGSYRFSALPPGIYRVSAFDPTKRYGQRFYPAAGAVQAARDIIVTGNFVTGIDLTLQPAGRVIVTVQTTPEYTLTYAFVGLRQLISTTGGSYWDQPYVANYVTNNNVFTFTGIPANTYRICAYGYGPKLSANECYDNVYDVAEATDLPLSAGGTISNVVIVFGDGANYAQIQGRVTAAADGTPLAGIRVYAYRITEDLLARVAAANTWRGPATATPDASPTAPLPAANDYYGYLETVTDSNGEYALATLPAGNYKLHFVDPVGNYAFAYHNHQVRLADATLFEVAPQMVISSVNSELATAARINGSVTLADQPAPDTNVLAERKIDEWVWEPVMQVKTNPNTGAYSMAGLPAGVYRVSAQAQIVDTTSDTYSVYFPYGVYGGATSAEAKAITLTNGAIATNIDITLNTLRYDGGLTGRVTASGQPLAGAKVALYLSNYGCCGFGELTPRLYTFTDADGRYTFSGLGSSRFFLGVSDPTGLYATTYYSNQISSLQALHIAIPNDRVLTDYNVDLPRAGAIQGLVRQRNNQAVAGLYVTLSRLDPPFEYLAVPTDGRTDEAGRYRLPGLHPGRYQVCFNRPTYPFRSECYIQPVSVTAGATTNDINLIWGPDLPFYLPLISQQ